jgi:hypothetical protein
MTQVVVEEPPKTVVASTKLNMTANPTDTEIRRVWDTDHLDF